MLSFLYIAHSFKSFPSFLLNIYQQWSLMNRYIFQELVKTHLVTLLFLYIILLINNFLVMAETLLSLNVGILQVIGLIISLTPSTLAWALPFSALIGCLLAIGRMSTDNEITAICFLGGTYYQLLRPFLIYGIILCIFSLFIMNILSPQAEKMFKKIMKNIAETTPNILIESNSSQKVGDTVILTGQISGGQIDGITIIDTDTQGYKRIIYSPKAYFSQGNQHKRNHGLTFKLDDVQGISAAYNVRRLDYQLIYALGAEYRLNIAPDQLYKMTTFTGKTISETWKNLRESKEKLEENDDIRMKQAANWLGHMSDIYARSLIKQNVLMSEISILYRRFENALPLNRPDTRYRSSFIDFYQQISLPIACFIFVFLAFSVAISTKKMHQTTMLALGIIFSMVYWFMLYLIIHIVIVGQASVWFSLGADLFFLALASFLFIRIKK